MTIRQLTPVLGQPISEAIHPQADPHGEPIREVAFACGCAARATVDADDYRLSKRCANAWHHEATLATLGVDPAEFDEAAPRIADID